MRIGFISDTHGQHEFIVLPEFDMLIHAGDVCSRGTESEAKNFITWFNGMNIKHKIFIAGNHDFYLEKTSDEEIRSLLNPNTHYLNDSGITIEGINIWGSPVQPWFYDWAFNRQRGQDIKKHWDLIPNNTDILITHGPPAEILDRTVGGEYTGCYDLLNRINEVNPNIHAFGHIHEAAGTETRGKTTFINASVLNERYRLTNEPVILELATHEPNYPAPTKKVIDRNQEQNSQKPSFRPQEVKTND